jgi:signal transduction histidine kinase
VSAAVAAAPVSATHRVERLMAVSLGFGGMLLLGLNLQPILETWTSYGVWWSAGAFVAMTVGSVGLAIAGMLGSPPALRAGFAVLSGALLLGVALAPLARVTPVIGSQLPWPIDVAVLGAAAAAAGFPVRAAIGYLIVLVGGLAALAALMPPPALREAALLHVLQTSFYASLFTAIAIASRRAGRLLDLAVESAVRDAREAAAAESRRIERRRVATLLHDTVIVALLAFGRGEPSSDARAAVEARRALDAVRGFEGPPPTTADPTAQELAWRLQALTTEMDAAIRFDYTVREGGRIPAAVAAALLEAASEALRNSLRHAGRGDGVARQVMVDGGADGIIVAVLDDGVGFDPAAVGATRLGIAQGIVRRMASAGGSGRVRSRPGRGTSVLLEWSRP